MSFRSNLSRFEKAQRVAIKFGVQDDFGNFCVELTNRRIPFSHLGSQTIALSGSDFGQLPSKLAVWLDEFHTNNRIQIYEPTPTRNRRILTKDASDAALRNVARKWKSRAEQYR